MSGAHLKKKKKKRQTAPRVSRLEAPREIRSIATSANREREHARLSCARFGFRFCAWSGATFPGIVVEIARDPNRGRRTRWKREFPSMKPSQFHTVKFDLLAPTDPFKASTYLVTVRAFLFSNRRFLVSLVRAMNRSLFLSLSLFLFFTHTFCLFFLSRDEV